MLEIDTISQVWMQYNHLKQHFIVRKYSKAILFAQRIIC